MTVESVKKKIKKKFRNYSKFARCAGIDRYEFQRDFLEAHKVERSEIKRIDALCDKLDPEDDDREIPQAKTDAFKQAVLRFGGVPEFSQHYGYAISTVRGLVLGERVKVTELVSEIFGRFNIEI